MRSVQLLSKQGFVALGILKANKGKFGEYFVIQHLREMRKKELFYQDTENEISHGSMSADGDRRTYSSRKFPLVRNVRLWREVVKFNICRNVRYSISNANKLGQDAGITVCMRERLI